MAFRGGLGGRKKTHTQCLQRMGFRRLTQVSSGRRKRQMVTTPEKEKEGSKKPQKKPTLALSSLRERVKNIGYDFDLKRRLKKEVEWAKRSKRTVAAVLTGIANGACHHGGN